MAESQCSAQPCCNAPSSGMSKHRVLAAVQFQHVMGVVDVGIAQAGKDGRKEKRKGGPEVGGRTASCSEGTQGHKRAFRKVTTAYKVTSLNCLCKH